MNYKDKDYYQILGISTAATKKEIKAAYRALARKYHPDVNPGNKLCEEKFKEIGEAYSTLVDDIKRDQYDRLKGINISRNQSNASQTKKQASSAYSEQKTKEKSSTKKETTQPKTDQKQFNDVFSDILNGIFKNTKYSNETTQQQSTPQKEYTAQPKRGDDITADISLTITEAHNGTVRKVNILHTDPCLKCKGRRVINGIQCIACDGKGELSTHKKISVKIPPNVKEGSKIRIPNEGNKGQNGGENGDLYLIVHIQKHSIFTFDNLNVLCEIPITPSEAALGADIDVPTIYGHINMKIPAETQNGQKFRLAGEGIHDSQNNKKGDQIVTVRIEIPKNLSEKEKQLYQELARIRKTNPRENIVYEK